MLPSRLIEPPTSSKPDSSSGASADTPTPVRTMNRTRRTLLICAASLAFAAVTGTILFGAAGRWDLPMFWAAIGVLTALGLVGTLAIEPSLLKERIKPGPGGRDKVTIVLGKLLGLGSFVIAGLDVGRFHWSDTVPLWLQILGLAAFALGFGVGVWAMIVNRFFSPLVRFQEERDHRLITSGPYRFVCHPAYAAILVGMPCLGFALGAWLPVLPLLVFSLLLLRRTRLEDRFLHEKLEGYTDYARRVRYRLLPGVW